ncbi:MAG: FG-GAP repeat protein [Longimicrobiales bacterium]
MSLRLMLIPAALVALAAHTAPLNAQGSNFASASAASGADIFVGQPANFYGPGAVYLYRSGSEGEWSEASRFFAPDSTLGDGFGHSLSAEGEYLLVGAPRSGPSGAVYLYSRASGVDGPWTLASSLAAPGGGTDTSFGATVAIEGSTGFVGAPDASDGSGVV